MKKYLLILLLPMLYFSLSTTAPAFRMNEEKVMELVVIVKEAANEISRRIGYKE